MRHDMYANARKTSESEESCWNGGEVFSVPQKRWFASKWRLTPTLLSRSWQKAASTAELYATVPVAVRTPKPAFQRADVNE